MEIDTSNLTDEQISKLSEFIHAMEKENNASKWWVMPEYSMFTDMTEYEKYGPCYHVEPQEESYSRSKPPLKSDFNSKEAAQKWLDDYLHEEEKFLKAIDELDNLRDNIGHLVDKLRKHERITNIDLHLCFESFNASWDKGFIREVIKEGENR